MSNKTHKIQSIEDIISAVNLDNIDGFLKDFELILRQFLLIKTLDNNIKFDGFDWCDDGKNKAEVSLSTEDGDCEVIISVKVAD